jgi:hypothetical protein
LFQNNEWVTGSWKVGGTWEIPPGCEASGYDVPQTGRFVTPVLVAATSTCRCFLREHAELIRQYVDGAGPIKTRDYSLTSDTDDGMNAEVYFRKNEVANENFHRLQEIHKKKTASQQSVKDVPTNVISLSIFSLIFGLFKSVSFVCFNMS